MMVALLLHGYASGLYSSRRIARAHDQRLPQAAFYGYLDGLLEVQIEFQHKTFNLGPNLLDPSLVHHRIWSVAHRLPIFRIRPNRDDGVFWPQSAFADA
jgi:hypothetical protein